MKRKKDNEEKRQHRKQLIMTTSMIMVSVLVISVASYAWYRITNTPKITNAEFTADTIGNLQISNVKDNNGVNIPEEYKDSIELFDGVSSENSNTMYLNPVTTEDGISFYKPVYNGDKIEKMQLLDEKNADDYKELHTKYVYEKKFFLKAGTDSLKQGKEKYYDIHFVGKSQDEISGSVSFDETTGTYVVGNKNTNDYDTAANSIRISFEFKNAQTGETVIYEPNSDKHNKGIAGTNMSSYTNKGDEKYGEYTTLKQLADKSFKISENSKGTDSMSDVICVIKEGVDVECTLRMWIEGTDEDCMNEIAADTMLGQIQFISTENLSYTASINVTEGN